MDAPQQREDRSLGDLLKDLTSEIRDLFRKEVELARTETGEKLTRVGTSTAALAVAGAVVLIGALFLIEAVVRGLTALFALFMSLEIAVWLAPLIVGGALALVGYGLLRRALDRLKHESLTPEKTKQTLQENAEWLKTRMK